ncbi:MAG: T9SS type A sorting domain-containing protein [Bacteroidetes bacterium]|nr:T9SS type A sorting domain-containing protein [Bacteroidota bacterium]
MKFTGLALLVLLISWGNSFCQTTGDYQTAHSGNWNQASTWQIYNGSSWQAAAAAPPSGTSAAVKTILATHTVTVTAVLNIDNLTVNGTLVVNAGITLNLNLTNPTTINGTLQNSGTVTGSSSLVTVNGNYNHSQNGGNIVTATWVAGSFCNITGTTNTVPSGLSQNFDTFTWNCAQTGTINFAGNLTSVGTDFIIYSTNGQQLQVATSQTPLVNIGNNLVVKGNSRLSFVTTGGGAIINIGGNFYYQSTNTSGSILKTTGSYTLNLTGDFNMNTGGANGLLSFSSGAGNGVWNMNQGNFLLKRGTLTRTGGAGAVNFNFNGMQTFSNDSVGTISSVVNFTVGSSTTLNMPVNMWDNVTDSRIQGSGTFTLNGILRAGSINPSGAIVTGTTLGNIRTSGVRTYASGSRIVYAGATGAQSLGNGHPSTGNVTTEIDNSSGVTFTTANAGNGGAAILVIPYDLIFTNGSLSVGTGRSLTMFTASTTGGTITPNGNTISLAANSNLVINGSGAFGIFPFPSGTQTFGSLTVSRTTSGTVNFGNPITVTGTTTISNGTVTLGGATTLTGNISLATGTVLAFDNQSLTTGGDLTFSGTGALSASGTSTLTMNSGAAITSDLVFLNTNNTVQSLTINYTNASGTVGVNAPGMNVTSSLTLKDGTLNISTPGLLTMGSNSVITRNVTGASPSSITTNSPSGGLWSVIYTGTASVTTGLEIPSAGSPQIKGLTVSTTGGTITLGQALSVGSDGITQNGTGGTFTCAANAVSTSLLSQTAGTFTSSSATLTLTGNLTLSGTAFNNNTGTVVFNGSSVISGTLNPSYYAVTINNVASVTAPATWNIQSNFTNNGTFSGGTGTVNFTGANVQTISGTSNTPFYNLTVNKSGGNLTASSAETVSNNLTLTAGTFNISSPVSMTNASGTLTLTAGTLAITANNLSLANGTNISRAAGVISTSSPGGGPWDVIYTGTSKTTGLEIPSSGNVLSVTLNNNSGTTITLQAGQALNVTNAFTITNSGRTFSSGSNNVSVGTLVNNGTFTASSAAASTGLTLNGNFTNAGTFNANNGTVHVGAPVTISGTIPTFNNFVIDAAGSFTTPASFPLTGSLTNNGSFTATGSTVLFSGNTAKQILGSNKIIFTNLTLTGGTNANDLTLATTAGADVLGIVNLIGVPNPAVLTINASCPFTLLSTADRPTVDASIATIPAGSSITGKVTVQRYMSKIGVAAYNYQVYHDISSPVNTNVADLQNSLPITGNFTGASVVSGVTNSNPGSAAMSWYNETQAGGIDVGWTDFPADGTDNTASFVKGRGYSLFVFGSDPPVSGSGMAKWSLTGPIWSGSFNLPVTYTNTGNASADGWNLVGNPYPSTIDWKAGSGWTKTNVDDAIYIDDYNTANPVFAAYVNGVGTNGGTQYVATGQGFWVHANAAAPVVGVSENVKVAGQQTTFFRQAEPSNLIRVALTDVNALRDETVIYFSDSATVGFDKRYDARKLNNQYGYLNLSSLSPVNEPFAIHAMPFDNSACAMTVPLKITNVVSGNYSLEFSEFQSMPASLSIKLVDKYIPNSQIDIRQTQAYSFSIDQTKPASIDSTRFSLLFTYSNLPPSIVANGSMVCDTTLAKVTIKNTSSEFYYSLKSSSNVTIGSPVQGNGSNIVFTVPSKNLALGKNTFTVQASNNFCQALSLSDTSSVNLVSSPKAPTVLSSTSCGLGSVTLTASGATGSGYYNWYDSLNAPVPYPVQSATFVTDSLSKAKTYYVSMTSNLGCEGPKSPVTANIVNLTPATITVTGLSTLQSNYAAGNQWYLNGSVISGATGQTLTLTQSGTYGLIVTSQGCSVTAPNKDMVVTAVENLSDKIKAYPVPVKGTLYLEVPDADQAFGEMYNAVGSRISVLGFVGDGQKQVSSYDFSHESAGIYFVRINQGNTTTIIRVIKD